MLWLLIIEKKYKKIKHFRFHLNPKAPTRLPAPKSYHRHVQKSNDLLRQSNQHSQPTH
jgi:hypothetical protein